MRSYLGLFLLLLLTRSASAELLEEIETGNLASFQHAGSLSEVVCHPDGVHVLSSSRDQCVRLWSIQSGQLVRRFTAPYCGDMWGIRFIKEGEEFLAASGSGKVYRFEVATGTVLSSYKQSGTAYRIAVHPDGKRFVGTDSKNNATLWEIETGRLVRKFVGHTDDVYTAIIVNDGKTLITGSDDATVRQWNLESGECLETLKNSPTFGSVFTLALSPDKARFAMVSGDNYVRVFDSGTLKELWKTKLKQEGEVICWSPDGSMVASTSDDSHLYLLNTDDGKIIRKIKTPRSSHTPITFTNDGKMLISGGDYVLHLHKVETGERVEPGMGFSKKYNSYDHIAVAPGGSRIYLADGSSLEIRDRTDPSLNKKLTDSREVSAMALSKDGKFIATGGSRGTITVRDTVRFEVVGTMSTKARVNALAFLADGVRLISGGDDKQAVLWAIHSGKRIREFKGHTDDILSLIISPDGRQMVTTARDLSVRLWSVLDGEEQALYLLDGQRPNSVSYLDGGRSLVVAMNEKEVWGRILPRIVSKVEMEIKDVRAFVKRLGDEHFEVREKALLELGGYGKQVIPLLKEMKSEDPEIRTRIQGLPDFIRGVMAKTGLKEIYELEDDLALVATDPLGEFWAGALGTGGASRLIVGETIPERSTVRVLSTVSQDHGCLQISFSPDGNYIGTVNADGTYSLFKMNRAQ